MRKRVNDKPMFDLIGYRQFAQRAGVSVPTLKRSLQRDGLDAPQPVRAGTTRDRFVVQEVESYILHGRAWRAIVGSHADRTG